MLTTRHLSWLLAFTILLTALIVAHLYFQVPHRKMPYAKAIDQASRITLTQGGAGIELQRNGKDWTVQASSSPAYPVDADRLRTLLSGLPELQLEDIIADRADRAPDFEVDAASGTRVTLYGSNHAALADGIVGKQAPDFNHIYFRFPDQSNVYLARGLIRGELGGAALPEWRSKDIVTTAEPDFRRIQIQKGGTPFTLERSSNTWMLEGRTINPAPVYTLTGALAHLKADSFIPDKEASTIKFSAGRIEFSTDKDTDTLSFSAPDATTHRIAVRLENTHQTYSVSEPKVLALFPKKSTFTAQ